MARPLSSRLASAGLVAGLHLPLILYLLYANLAPGVKRILAEPPHEAITLLPVPDRAKPSAAPVKGPEHFGTGTYFSPDTVSPYFSAPSSGATVGSLAFGCAPENLKNLTRAEQEKCLKLAGGTYALMRDGLPKSIKLPGPEWKGLRNSDIRARERNTADPCMAAKATGTECIHTIIYGKGLW